MAATTVDIDTAWNHKWYEQTPSPLMKGATIIPNGAAVCYDAAGFLVNAANVAGLITCGVAKQRGDSTGIADGVMRLRVDMLIAEFATSGGSAIVQADVGDLCYWLDNQTVVKLAGAANGVIAGRVKGISPQNGKIIVDMSDRAPVAGV